MKNISKRFNKISEEIDLKKTYNIHEALFFAKKYAISKFNESIDVSICMNLNIKKYFNIFYGSVLLPSGTGKSIKIAAFVDKKMFKQSLNAGADFVGLENLIEKVKNNIIEFDVAITTPDVFPIIKCLGSILGPKSLMPSLKKGTVTNDIENTIRNFKFGKVNFKSDKNGVINTTIGRASFSIDNLYLNFKSIINFIKKNKISNKKNKYFRKIVISSTMGFGIIVNINNDFI